MALLNQQFLYNYYYNILHFFFFFKLEPTMITHPPANLTFRVGFPYGMLYCGASYDLRLDLRIDWYKSGVLMNKLGSRIFLESRASGPSRILYFHDFVVTDAAVYSCHVYTKYGDIVSEQWAHGSIKIKGIIYDRYSQQTIFFGPIGWIFFSFSNHLNSIIISREHKWVIKIIETQSIRWFVV